MNVGLSWAGGSEYLHPSLLTAQCSVFNVSCLQPFVMFPLLALLNETLSLIFLLLTFDMLYWFMLRKAKLSN